MDKTKKVKVTIFKKPAHLKNEKCECSKEAVWRVVASFKNEHRHVFCCKNQKCLEKASHLAAERLFRGPRPLSLGPEKFIEAGAELIDTFSFMMKR